jgi:hypothetical protein
MMYSMNVLNFMWSCAVSKIVYHKTANSVGLYVGPSGGLPLTLTALAGPNAYKFLVFGCTIFAEVPDKLRRKQNENAFRGVMVDYRTDTLGYRVYNPVTRCTTASMQVVFQADV